MRWKLKELRDLQEVKTFQPDKVEEHLPEDLNPNATQDRTLQVQAQRTLEEKETGGGELSIQRITEERPEEGVCSHTKKNTVDSVDPGLGEGSQMLNDC